ncbi:MAG: hypothetical protein KDD99_19180 [Bacteroidetes bacterium]|nr:hypothetical protein [Bacteroidota bacterium]
MKPFPFSISLRFSFLYIFSILLFTTVLSSTDKSPIKGEKDLIKDIGPDLQLRTAFGSVNTLKVKTQGIFAISWDPKFNHEADLPLLFSWLETIRKDCIENLGMADPPNPQAGYYYNVYIHHGKEDLFPEDWGNGQGTDKYDMPFLTLPAGAHLDKMNIHHEGFHIFQYSANSPGYQYWGNSQWYVESAAQWYMSDRNPTAEGAFVEAGAISANPQLALWHSYDNKAPGDAEDWLYLVRQYGMHTYLFYLTNVARVDPEIITEGFYAKTDLSPQQYHLEKIGAESLRSYFADWAAHNTGGFDYLSEKQWERALTELENVADPQNMNPYVLDLAGKKILGTHKPPSKLLPRGWAYNVIKLSSPTKKKMTFKVNGEKLGSEGGQAHFEGRIVMKGNAGFRYENIKMTDRISGSKTIKIRKNESEIYFIIASVPEHFTGNQTYGYSVEIK